MQRKNNGKKVEVVPARKPKVLLFDLEASNLAANFGFMFCVGYMHLEDKEPKVLSVRDNKKQFKKDPTNDKELIEKFRPIVEGADVIVAHYGKKFDAPFLQTRCFEHGLRPLNLPALIDTWHTARYTLKFNSNRLDTINRSLPGTSGLAQKTPIDNKAWVRGPSGHIPSLKEIEKHCYFDILVLKNTYLGLRPFMLSHPHLARLVDPKSEACPACNSTNLQKNGKRVTSRGVSQRWECLSCGNVHVKPITAKVA